MGFAIARAVLEQGILPKENLLIVERDPERRSVLSKAGIRVCSTVEKEVGSCDIVVLAVKPQDACAAAGVLHPVLSGKELVVSIVAGIRISRLCEMLGGYARIIRAMPNLAACEARGMTVFCVSKAVREDECLIVEKLFTSFGKAMRVAEEEKIDAATAVSGSGPGYLFYVLENLLQGSIDLGFPREEAMILVKETLRGVLDVWEAGELDPSELKTLVESKGGTTAAAFSVFREGRLGEVLREGMNAALKRAKELSEAA